MAGYSGTPLLQKLGITAGDRVYVAGGELALPDDVTRLKTPRPPIDVAVLFVTKRAELEKRWDAITTALAPDGGFWVAWPKKASKLPTDMTENVVREIALPRKLVDNKVCAIDDTWSGLRLVVRKEHRAAWPHVMQ